MSAKTITVFLPKSLVAESMLIGLTKQLRLVADELPTEKKFDFQFSAQIGVGKDHLLIEYREEDEGSIKEIGQWERPSNELKESLFKCQSSIMIYYRLLSNAKEAILAIAALLGERGQYCMVENGLGCLLTLDSVVYCLRTVPDWTWEKDLFPELPNVAASEWR